MHISIVVPTYNEIENLPILAEKVLGIFDSNDIDGTILVVDDNSPDGTGKLADGLAADGPRIEVQLGESVDEDDIVRFDDEYGRMKNTSSVEDEI